MMVVEKLGAGATGATNGTFGIPSGASGTFRRIGNGDDNDEERKRKKRREVLYMY